MSGQRDFNIQFQLLPETMGGQFRKDFPPYIDGLVRTIPHGYITTPVYAKNAEDFYNLKPRPDDVYVLTFPKSGNSRNILIFNFSWILEPNNNRMGHLSN